MCELEDADRAMALSASQFVGNTSRMRAEDRNVVRMLQGANSETDNKVLLPPAGVEAVAYALDEKHEATRDVEAAKGIYERPQTRSWRKWTSHIVLALGLISILRAGLTLVSTAGSAQDATFSVDICPQAPALSPTQNAKLLQSIEDDVKKDSSRLIIYEALGGAVQIPTQMYDDLPPPDSEDPRWDIFVDLHSYLQKRFPLVHKSLKKTVLNKYALVFHWQGSDESLKPALLTAHQDVVPVEPQTVDTWKNPPFSGLYDGEWIWGRGSCDDKSGLISSLISVEKLLERGFNPQRSVVLAFGIDEERGGVDGATAIRDYLTKSYGENAFSILVDEGGRQVVGESVVLAGPAVAEKGSYNLRLEVATPGGHSSVPPPHTGIGILASLITALEANPHVPHLYRTDTYYQELQCLATHSPDFPSSLRNLVKKSATSDKALKQLEDELARTVPTFFATAGTTQAVDVIRGGVKTNALPENAYVIVNHRIAGYSSVKELQDHILDTVQPVAKRFNLSIDAFGKELGLKDSAAGRVSLSDAFGTGLEPAPVTSTTGHAYRLLSGTIRNVVETSQREAYKGKAVLVAPTILLGNTDTKHYWNLTKNIFRYSHLAAQDAYNGAHTVNEAVRAEGIVEMVRFFTHLILNIDEAREL